MIRGTDLPTPTPISFLVLDVDPSHREDPFWRVKSRLPAGAEAAVALYTKGNVTEVGQKDFCGCLLRTAPLHLRQQKQKGKAATTQPHMQGLGTKSLESGKA